MKSDERHRLESNTLATYLSKWVDSGMPYGQAAVLTVLAILAGVSLWTWYGRTASSRQGKAWLDYNLAVEGRQPNLEMLKRVAEDHADSPVGELSEITWADGQVFNAAATYLTSKSTSKEFLDSATAKYEELIKTTTDPLLVSRAHFGLGRVYEMRADLEKAKLEYEKVSGPLQALAEQRLEQLKNPQATEALGWLATAEVPRRVSTSGSGAAGPRPDFQVDELATPGSEQQPEPSIEDIFKRIGELGTPSPERYAPPGDQPPPGVTQDDPAGGPQSPSDDQPPADNSTTEAPMPESPPAEEAPAPVDQESEKPQP